MSISKLKYLIILISILFVSQDIYAQNIFKAMVKNEQTMQPVSGATVSVEKTDLTATSDSQGNVELTGIPDGEQSLVITCPGYQTKHLHLVFPLGDRGESRFEILLNNELDEVTITTTTRISREIDDVPTRIEAINEEEIDEKISMRPANVSMVLNESTGIKVQQTSATAYTQSIRIQGLDGRYTQMLKDGFPVYGGFSGSLSLLDIPPLDLKQVEIIKGPSATFYGGGAIAGVVNFISKEPEDTRQTTLILNQTSALGTDISLFDSAKFGRIGYTFLGSINYQREYDVDDDNFTELPRTKSFNLNPRVFFELNDKTRLVVGNSSSYQNRTGGDVGVIRGKAGGDRRYFEENHSFRNITTLQFDRELEGGRKLAARQSLILFDRKSEIPDYLFEGRQVNSYSDVSYIVPIEGHSLVIGANAVYDRFREDPAPSGRILRNETRTTFGGYLQDNFSLTDKLSMEAGFRLDHLRDYGVFALPRVSLLYRVNEHLSSRVNFGLGYKAPSVFTENAEVLLFQNVLPIGNGLEAERSRGGTFDINYRNNLGDKISYSINQMFFYTRIDNPLLLGPAAQGSLVFTTAAEPIVSSGFETNGRFVYGIARIFIGYTYNDAKAKYLQGNQILPLVPKSRLNSAFLLEKEEAFKAGFEAYYTSSQYLTDRTRTRPYWVFGIFGEKIFGKMSVFFNAENITDTRQGRFGPVVFPPFSNPTFSEIYTHIEGRIFNGGIKLRF